MRVLLVRAGALGDVLLLRRAVFALKQSSYAVALLAPERSAAALVGPGPSEIDEVVPWESAEVAALLAGTPPQSLVDRLRAQQRVVAYTANADLLQALKATGVHVQAHDPKPPAGRAAADWFVEPIRDLVSAEPVPPPSMVPTEAERLEAERLGRDLPAGFLAVHPGSGSPRKNWPADRLAALVARLSPGRPYLLVRGPADATAASELERDPNARVARELPVRVLGALLARAGLYVGNDSGVSHLAAAYGAPSLVLFGPTDPATWRPIGERVTVATSQSASMNDMPLEAVIETAVRLLDGHAA